MTQRRVVIFLTVLTFVFLFNGAYAETFEAFGRSIDTDAETLDLSDLRRADARKLHAALSRMPNIKQVLMFRAPLEKQEMDMLSASFPDVFFGWTIRVGKYRLRTDASSFSTLRQPDEKPRYKSESYAPLRFCRNLKGLDLGHNSISDLGFVGGLKQLHYLILADNRITDISELSKLKNLEYLELFMNDITDITPLLKLPNLIDLNLSRTRIADLSPLCAMKQLRRLWISRVGSGISEEEMQMLRESLPDTEIVFTANCTAHGWRRHPRFDKVKVSFRGKQIFQPWTEEERSL